MAKLTAQETRALFLKNLHNLKTEMGKFSDRKFVAGIDPSLTGAAIVICKLGPKPRFFRFRCSECFERSTRKSETVYQRLHLIKARILMVLRNFPCRLVLIEGYSYNKKQNRELMGEVGNAIREVMWSNPEISGPTIVAAPTQLKKYIAGQSQKVPKEKVILNVYKEFGIEVMDNDEADALVLSSIGHDLLMRLAVNADDIPNSDSELMKFLKNAHTELGMQRYKFEVLQAIVTSQCGDRLYDVFNTEDWFA